MMEQEEIRRLQEAAAALADNAFWLWFCREIEEKRRYILGRFSEAKNWEEVCRWQGAFAETGAFLGLIREWTDGAE
ncbi:MAG: hypothetical protein K6B40_05360 [Firmicutes bacterium]|nr:hypothetical protein [Bacillota bacterium]